MDRKRILCFGDSNTYGYDPKTDGRYDDEHRWPSVMQSVLGGEYDVISEGLNGRTTVFGRDTAPYGVGIDYFIPCALSHYPIERLIVMLGTNDATYVKTAQEISAGLEKILEMAMRIPLWEEKTKITVVVPPYIAKGAAPDFADEFTKRAIANSIEIAPLYEALAKKYNFDFFDSNAVAAVGETDLLHLDPESHVRLGKALAETIK